MDHRQELVDIAVRWLNFISDYEAVAHFRSDDELEDHFRFYVRGQPPGGMGLRHRLDRSAS